MGLIPEDTIQEIIRANDIVQVVEQYLPLDIRAAQTFSASAPFTKRTQLLSASLPQNRFFIVLAVTKAVMSSNLFRKSKA